jgi:Ca-activated chloride channel family protein
MMGSFEGRPGLWAGRHPVPLRAVAVAAVVQAGQAAVVLRQLFRNHELRTIEAVYTFPLPAGAALTRLSARVGGRLLTATVRPRSEAVRAYEEALSSGRGGLLLEQERDEVATLSVGNILPGEEVAVEIELIEPLQAREGALRWRLPTRVAPRYIPGVSTGVRDGTGTSLQTDRVPDADRISPPRVPWSDLSFELDLLVDLGQPVQVESPSHELRLEEMGGQAVRATLASRIAGLDRDLVVTMQLDGGSAGVAVATRAHREEPGPGVFALTLIPDLPARVKGNPLRVALLLDVSGSMAGPPLEQAVAAARLCLRHLRPGDYFQLLAFNGEVHRMDGHGLRVFDEETLQRADRWLRRLQAEGGTELHAPLMEALHTVDDGVVVLLTDGQVAEELAIYRAARATGSTARIYGIGLGTDVCEGLLRDLARASGGNVELIYPGEAIDAKVLAQFTHATAPRVDGVEMILDGLEVDGLTPAALPPLVDGQPWSVMGRYVHPGAARGLLVGRLDGEPFELEFTLDLPARGERPTLPRMWARGRIHDLELAEEGDPEENRWQILELATAHGLACHHTALVIVEEREGERLATGQPATRVVEIQDQQDYLPRRARGPVMPRKRRSIATQGPLTPIFRRGMGGQSVSPPTMDFMYSEPAVDVDFEMERERGITLGPPSPPPPPPLPGMALLQRQGATGLWGGPSHEEQIAATTDALKALADLGITTDHDLHGVPVRKGLRALLDALGDDTPAALRDAALEAARRVASGRRDREAVQQRSDALRRQSPT